VVLCIELRMVLCQDAKCRGFWRVVKSPAAAARAVYSPGRRPNGAAPAGRFRRAPPGRLTNKPSSVSTSLRWQRGSFLYGRPHDRPPATYPGLRRSGPLLVPYVVLLRTGFTVRPTVTGGPVRSYRTLSPLPVPSRCRSGHRRSALCGTLHRLTAPGRYPAFCPAELGLSSRTARSGAGDPHSRASSNIHRGPLSGGTRQNRTSAKCRRGRRPKPDAPVAVPARDILPYELHQLNEADSKLHRLSSV